jgi:MFS transporter, OFA family, oxalate/formate antiporter
MNETSQMQASAGGLQGRWAQLVIGIICMAMVANLQYGWTLFVNPIQDAMHWKKAAIQVSFSLFVLTETWLVPFEGFIVDKFGPRPVVLFGGILAGLAWVIDSMATTLPVLYIGGIVAGVGAGCVYGTCVGNALKWFPDKRGLAAGLTAAGFGAGAALTVIPIAHMVRTAGYQHAFFVFGLAQGIVIIILSLFLIRPITRAVAAGTTGVNLQSTRQYSPSEILRTPVFWTMYVIFVLVAAGGLMATAQVGPIAKDYGLAKLPWTYFGATLPLLTVVLSIDSLCNGFTRPLTGWISDHIGRENTMFLVFAGEGVAMIGLMTVGHNPYAFIFFAALTFLCYGEIFSIFPAAAGDTFGSKFAAANNGTLYTAKGTASLLVPLASVLKNATGSWHAVFVVAFIMAILASLGSKFVLSPMRRRFLTESNAEAAEQVGRPAFGGE